MSEGDAGIIIIGAGFSGLGLGIQLTRAGIDDFQILEKADRLGGTWRENTYPGAECDVASALYSYSFERNPRWTHKWSHQPEILRYMEHCSSKYGIDAHMRFDTEVVAARFDEDAGRWDVELADGSGLRCQALVSAVGQLHHPSTPKLVGAERFAGPSFHSARWDHSVDLRDRDVLVIGNAASAIQFIPQIAKQARKVRVLQRSPNWMMPKLDREYREWEKKLGTWFPFLTALPRLSLWLRGELMLYPLMSRSTRLRERAEKAALEYLESKIADPELRAKLTPDFPIGAKRILFSDDYYDAVARDDVEIITSPVAELDADGLRTEDGEHHPGDVLIYATGFETSRFFSPIRIEGRGGRCLNDEWAARGAEAYLGITHTGYPNFFMMYGPNTNLGHNSIIVMAECQMRYIVSCIRLLRRRGLRFVDLEAAVQRRYNEWLDRRMAKKVWGAIDDSWYQTAGRVTNNWVGSTQEYWWRTRRFDAENYELVSESVGGAE